MTFRVRFVGGGEVEFVYVRTVGVTPGPGAFYISNGGVCAYVYIKTERSACVVYRVTAPPSISKRDFWRKLHISCTGNDRIGGRLDFDDIPRALPLISRREIGPSSRPACDLKVASAAVALCIGPRLIYIPQDFPNRTLHTGMYRENIDGVAFVVINRLCPVSFMVYYVMLNYSYDYFMIVDQI